MWYNLLIMKKVNRILLQSQAIALIENGYTYNDTAKSIGVDKTTVQRWVKEYRTHSNVKEKIKPILEKQLELTEYELASLSAQQLKKRLKDDKKINKAKLSEITNAYKTIREIQGKGATGTQINIQINHNNNEFTISKD